MAVEVLTPNSLVATDGSVASFSEGTFNISSLGDSNGSTGLLYVGNNASIDFGMSDPTISGLFSSATMNITITTNGSNAKNAITITALDDRSQVGRIFGNEGTGTFSIDITSLGITRITDANFRITAVQATTAISEVAITINTLETGRVTISSGQLLIKTGRVTI